VALRSFPWFASGQGGGPYSHLGGTLRNLTTFCNIITLVTQTFSTTLCRVKRYQLLSIKNIITFATMFSNRYETRFSSTIAFFREAKSSIAFRSNSVLKKLLKQLNKISQVVEWNMSDRQSQRLSVRLSERQFQILSARVSH